jgi:hypothetical protein
VKKVLAALLLSWSISAIPYDRGDDFPYPAFDDLSIRGFAQEVLYGTGTGRTSLFNDYKQGSYHVQPKELLERLPSEARSHKLQLHAAVVIGPVGPLWAYDVIAFLQEASCTRVNRVVVPHARITFKATACLPDAEAAEWLSRFRKEITPEAGPSSTDPDSCVTVAEYTGRSPALAHARFSCSRNDASSATDLLDSLRQELGKRLVATYYTYPPVPDQE